MSVESMKVEEIQGYKNTTLTILHKQIGILHQLDEILKKEESNKNEEKEGKESKDGILTIEKSNTFKEILKNEINKLENFDVVLAVVGTMKAGKSTTINAIVGREILPNRNRPMTALPTLICHNPDKKTPSISINPVKLNGFLAKLRTKLNLVPKADAMHQDMKNLIDFVANGGTFHSYYEGEEKIFNFLYQLNDLVRLTKQINIAQVERNEDILKFPFDEYKNFENLPRIDVAFNLENNFNTKGRFMLLDTAGPNEAGQEELEEALAQQLERSSAVMLVLDYTQLNSDAEKDVKNQIDNIPTVQKSRLFALVNKFDQKNANADEADATRKHIFHNLLKDKIELGNIYAVSAQDSYLANRLLAHIEYHNQKPEYQEDNWVADFAKKMYGRRPEKEYNASEIDDVKNDIRDLLEDSRMQEPMQNIIVNMQKNAPFIAMQSALAGSSQVFDSLHNTLDIRGFFAEKENLSKQEIAEIEDVIARLTAQKQDIEVKKNELIRKFDEIKRSINTRINLDEKIRLINLETQNAISEMFAEESASAKKQLEEIKQKRTIWGQVGKYLTTYQSENEVANEKAKLDELRDRAKSDGNNLIFSTEHELEKFQEQASITVNQFINDTVVKAFDGILDESIDVIKEVVSEINDESNDLLKQLKGDFYEKGIDLRIDFDGIGNLNKQTAKIGTVKLRANPVTHSEIRKDTGMLGGLKRGLGGLFGKTWGTYTVNYTTYTISKKETIGQFTTLINKDFITPLNQQVQDKVQFLLTQSTDYIEAFNKKVDEIINEMTQGIEYQNRTAHQSKEEKQAYHQLILDIQQDHKVLNEDWDKIAEKFKVEAITTSAQVA